MTNMEISKLPENAGIVAIQFNSLALHYGVLLIPNTNFSVLIMNEMAGFFLVLCSSGSSF